MTKFLKGYFKNLSLRTPQDVESMLGHFSTLCMKGKFVVNSGNSMNCAEFYSSFYEGLEVLYFIVILLLFYCIVILTNFYENECK